MSIIIVFPVSQSISVFPDKLVCLFNFVNYELHTAVGWETFVYPVFEVYCIDPFSFDAIDFKPNRTQQAAIARLRQDAGLKKVNSSGTLRMTAVFPATSRGDFPVIP